MSALKTLRSLRTLNIETNHCEMPLELDQITGLTAVCLDLSSSKFSGRNVDALAKMVANSPQLTSIDFFPSQCFRTDTTSLKHSLHHLLEYIPSDAARLRLHHLGLNACLLRLDDATLPHLRRLKSLRLTNLYDPYTQPHGSQSTNIKNAQKQKQVGSSIEELWRTMAHEGIWLEDIVHEDVCPGFLEYLSSYSGLKSLKLVPDQGGQTSSYANAQAQQFFAQTGPLIHHSHTLEKLVIKPRYEGRWCFDMVSPPESLSACVKLKTLRLSVLEAQMLRRTEVSYDDIENDIDRGERIETENAIVSNFHWTWVLAWSLIGLCSKLSLTLLPQVCQICRFSRSTVRICQVLVTLSVEFVE